MQSMIMNALSFLIFSTLAILAACKTTWVSLPGADYSGTDVLIVTAETPASCTTACDTYNQNASKHKGSPPPSCVAVIHVPSTNTCVLKSALPAKRAKLNPKAILYVPYSKADPNLIPGFRITGSEIGSGIRVANTSDCQEACRAAKKCVATNYMNKWCQLSSAKATLGKNPQFNVIAVQG
ncbi:hypothetical protein BDR26DRAFT_849419 [Obelidium mucronatum]|nr:hypothetical protein BDR26DRAFT_849419 [Obelidium mucronatum]